MNENNFDSLDEQQIAELYGDVLEEPTYVAGAFADWWRERVTEPFNDMNECARNTDGLASLRCGFDSNGGRGYN